MTKEEAKKEAFFKDWKGVSVEDALGFQDGWGKGWDAGHAAANQWTYLPELPKEDDEGEYIVTVTYGDSTETETDYWTDEGWRYFNQRVIAWRPLPEPAEIKRSEDEV